MLNISSTVNPPRQRVVGTRARAGKNHEEITIGEHLYGQALQTCRYPRPRVVNGNVPMPEKARKAASLGHLNNQAQRS